MQHAENRAERVIVFDRGRIAIGIAEHPADQMRVRVNEAGQQSYVAQIDHLCTGRDGNIRPANSSDLVVNDDDDRIFNRRRAGAVNQARCFQHNDALAHRRHRPNSYRCGVLRRHGKTKAQDQYWSG